MENASLSHPPGHKILLPRPIWRCRVFPKLPLTSISEGVHLAHHYISHLKFLLFFFTFCWRLPKSCSCTCHIWTSHCHAFLQRKLNQLSSTLHSLLDRSEWFQRAQLLWPRKPYWSCLSSRRSRLSSISPENEWEFVHPISFLLLQ